MFPTAVELEKLPEQASTGYVSEKLFLRLFIVKQIEM